MILGILDDHPLIRQGVKSVLKPLLTELEIVGFESIELIESYMENHKIDYVLVDLFLKKTSGFDFIRYVREQQFDTKCIVFSSSANIRDYKKAMELGAMGYVLKESLPEDLLYAIRLVIRGRVYIDPIFMGAEKKVAENYDLLTEREYKVFELIGKGYGNYEIAERLFISVNTVKKHVSKVFNKLESTERTQVAILANDHFGRRGI